MNKSGFTRQSGTADHQKYPQKCSILIKSAWKERFIFLEAGSGLDAVGGTMNDRTFRLLPPEPAYFGRDIPRTRNGRTSHSAKWNPVHGSNAIQAPSNNNSAVPLHLALRFFSSDIHFYGSGFYPAFGTTTRVLASLAADVSRLHVKKEVA